MDCDLCQNKKTVDVFGNEKGQWGKVQTLYLCEECSLLIEQNRWRPKSRRLKLKQRRKTK